MEQTLLELYQTLKYDDVYFNVNRLFSFFGSTKYITAETWGTIAVLIVNSISAKNKKETLLYYYSKMVDMAYERPYYYKGYKAKIPFVVDNLVRLYGTYSFCLLEISRDLIRSMISWFPFRNRSLYNVSDEKTVVLGLEDKSNYTRTTTPKIFTAEPISYATPPLACFHECVSEETINSFGYDFKPIFTCNRPLSNPKEWDNLDYRRERLLASITIYSDECLEGAKRGLTLEAMDNYREALGELSEKYIYDHTRTIEEDVAAYNEEYRLLVKDLLETAYKNLGKQYPAELSTEPENSV